MAQNDVEVAVPDPEPDQRRRVRSRPRRVPSQRELRERDVAPQRVERGESVGNGPACAARA